ncbi:flagellar hook-basal body complex protein FliE [Nitrobacteraceae bacterium AZCC 1564]
MASPTVAANAYANLARILDASAGVGKPAEAGGASAANLARIMEGGLGQTVQSNGPSFGAVLKDAIGGVMDAGRKSDAQTIAMAQGKANVMDVVTAVAETDVAVSTLVSVRDRVIQSYEDIMKMPI